MKNTPNVSKKLKKTLQALGQRLRDRRKELGISAITTAEASEMSRITLYRIEKGEASVAMGAYLSAIAALGLTIDLIDPAVNQNLNKKHKLPQKIRIASYRQLKRLAWQLKGTQELTPEEALDLYERNWRHVDLKSMDSKERNFIKTLLTVFGRERMLV